MLRLKTKLICEQVAIGKYIGQLILDSPQFNNIAPLETFEKLTGFNSNAFSEVLRCMELGPVTLGHKSPQTDDY